MPHIHHPGTDIVAELYIVRERKVLLRLHDKHKIWLPPGGHVEQVNIKEDPTAAALREVYEEVGLSDVVLWNPLSDFWRGSNETMGSRTPLVPPVHMDIHNVKEEHWHVALVFFGTSEAGEVREALDEKEKSGGLKWCTREDLETMVLPPSTKHYALHALNVHGQ